MKEFLLGKRYPEHVVDTALRKVLNISRENSLVPKPATNTSIIPFVVTFGATAVQAGREIHNLFEETIQKDEELKEIFQSKITLAYKRPKNLRDMLVRARIPPLLQNPQSCSHPNPGTIPCGSARCLTYKHVTLSERVVGPTGSLKLWDQFTCKSSCIIYAITCVKCPAIYIGQTKRRLHNRFREHLYFLGKPEATAVGEHFHQIHSREDMRITAIQKAPVDLQRRLEAESRVIFKLGTNNSPGLNTDFKFE